jgi:signal transduction histidine kinase
MLHEFLRSNRDSILALAQTLVAPGDAPRTRTPELSRVAPAFMEQLMDALTLTGGEAATAIEDSARAHGASLMRAGLACAQVVHDYGSVCQAITGRAHEMRVSITSDEFRTLNRCLDDAIAGAVTEFTRLRAAAIDHVESEHLAALARDLRKHLVAALLTYRVLKTGTVGISGSTGTELGRNLRRVSSLIDRTMADVRLDAGVQSPERMSVFACFEEIEVGASLEAHSRGLGLTVTSVGRDVHVHVDRQLLTAAVSNLVQNALQFSRKGGHISLRSESTADRVCIEVKDECGGLPAGQRQEVMRAFLRPGERSTPLGPGLSIVRRSVDAIGAELRVHDTPGVGCTFTIDLPRHLVPMTGTTHPSGGAAPPRP